MEESVTPAATESSSNAPAEDKNDVSTSKENGSITGSNGQASTDVAKESGTKGCFVQPFFHVRLIFL